jgi:hypothetical protein
VKFRSLINTLFGLAQGHGSWSCAVGAHAWRLGKANWAFVRDSCVHFEGFHLGTRSAILALEPEDPDREVAQP